ncbi:MAG: AMP-binding protein [Oscillospiraceae bacterium]|nr:AMP-binding protein [Oscillospiraceae bacterium]
MAAYGIDALLENGILHFPEHPYIFERSGDAFEGVAFASFAGDVRNTAVWLKEKGLEDTNIMLYGANSYAYLVADSSIMGYVGVSCTISKEWKLADVLRAAEILHISAILYDAEHEDTVEQLQKVLPELLCISLNELPKSKEPEQHVSPKPIDSCCKIIFSSGTTGKPKAVMLSQKQMFANLDSLLLRTPFTIEDRDYLFLPLSHTYSSICNFLYSLCVGMQIYLCSDTGKIMEELQMVRPTVFCAVPLIYERIYEACVSNHLSPVSMLGGAVRFLFCGGAYFQPKIRKYLKGYGLNLLEAYGLTETSSIISVEYTDTEEYESVGTVMENQEVMILDPDENGIGEIMVRGENLFSSYYQNPSATKEAFTKDGWFHTGDLGYLDGRKLYLKGRKRKMILLSNGENIFPDEIEAKFADYPQLSKVKIYAYEGSICAELYTAQPCDGAAIVEEVNRLLPHYAKIRKFECIRDSISVRLK